MASWMGGDNPIYAMRDSLGLQAKIKEATTLGPAGAKTDLIQKLALSAQPSRDQLFVMRNDGPDRAVAKGKSGFAAFRPADIPRKTEAPPTQVQNVYRETNGFAAVA